MAHTFNEENFEVEVLKSNVPVLVDFWAPWCGPCQMMGPIVEELAHEFPETKVKVGKLNIDESGSLASKYGVLSIPSFLIFKGGEVIATEVGGMSKDQLKSFVEEHIS